MNKELSKVELLTALSDIIEGYKEDIVDKKRIIKNIEKDIECMTNRIFVYETSFNLLKDKEIKKIEKQD